MHARVRNFVLALVVVSVAPAMATGQQTSAVRSTLAAPAAPAAPAAGPRVALTATAFRRNAQLSDSARTAALAQRRRQNMGRPVALMIVGGAAIVLGAVIGGDAGTLFMIGGAVAGLIGLYQYLQ